MSTVPKDVGHASLTGKLVLKQKLRNSDFPH
jgi:hypothetical protein